MKREWSLLVVATTATVVLVLALLRWIAPGLVGAPRDLQLVQVAREVPAFYDNVFRDEDWNSDEFILNDPVTIKRSRPLLPDQVALGPHDVLGFRNRAVPNIADVVVLGDSQTYGTNVPLEWNWPSRLAEALGSARATVYNMSCSGWDAIQYVDMAEKAFRLRPRVLVVEAEKDAQKVHIREIEPLSIRKDQLLIGRHVGSRLQNRRPLRNLDKQGPGKGIGHHRVRPAVGPG